MVTTHTNDLGGRPAHSWSARGIEGRVNWL